VCGPAGARAGATRSALGSAHEQARVDEAVESAPRNIPVDGLGRGQVVCTDGPPAPADEPQGRAQLRNTNRLQFVHLLYCKVHETV
jgi:hypothetical protein